MIPGLRIWKITCAATRNFITALAAAVIIPFANALGYFWSEIKVRTLKTLNEEEKKDDVLLV